MRRISSSTAVFTSVGVAFSATTSGHITRRPFTTTVRDALNTAVDEEMARDPSVFVIGEEVGYYNGAYKVSKGLLEKYGSHRVIDTPITEYGFAGIGVGAAMKGLRPVVEFMSFNFSLQAIDHIVNSAAKGKYMSGGSLSCPIVFRGCNGASAGVGAQHSQCLAPWYASVPGLKVFAVYNAEDARGMIKAAIRDPGPVVLLEHELLYGASYDMSDADAKNVDFLCPYTAKIERPGTDLTLISFARGVQIALDAAKILQEKGIADAEVINLRSLRPIDRTAILTSVHKTHRVITIDESWPICSIGAEVSAMIMESDAFDALDAPVERISCADVPTPYSQVLEKASQPQVEDVVEAAIRVCSRRRY